MLNTRSCLFIGILVIVFGVVGYFVYRQYFVTQTVPSSSAPAATTGTSSPNTAGSATDTNTSTTQPLVGGDRDEHGCIGSAGYSWCAPKNKCLRIWEEKCFVNAGQEIQYLLAKKYNKPVTDVKLHITKQDDTHVVGSVIYGSVAGEGGLVLAAKIENVWTIVFDGNGSVDCSKLKTEYGFTPEMLAPNVCED